MLSLQDFSIELFHPIFESDEFQDTSEFRDWLLRSFAEDDSLQKADTPQIKSFKMVYAIVQHMSQWRFLAEEYYHKYPDTANNIRDELYLSADEILKRINDLNSQKTPPETVITRIARNHIHIIESVLQKIRKILRCERQLTPLNRIQQIDSGCMTWLSRQPGHTTIQKAGAKQKLMGIVRKESYNTLENRVLKKALTLCYAYGKRYLKEHEAKFSNSDRISSVKHLCNTVKRALEREEFSSVATLHGQIKPNYVLLHDSHYSVIWQIYLDLLHQTSLMEQAWRNRAALLQQYCYFNLLLAVRKEYTPLFHDSLFFSSNLTGSELFLQNSFLQEFFTANNTPFQLQPGNIDEHSAASIISLGQSSAEKSVKVSFIFLPEKYWNIPAILPNDENHYYWIFGEQNSKKSYSNIQWFSRESSIFQSFRNKLSDMLGVKR